MVRGSRIVQSAARMSCSERSAARPRPPARPAAAWTTAPQADWHSPSSRVVEATQRANRTDLDLVMYDLASGTSSPLTSSPANELHPRFEPRGAWVAYASDETGEREIFVRPANGGSAIRVPFRGGDFPMWRADGRELAFLAPDGPMMSALRPAATGDFQPPAPLFRLRVRRGSEFNQFDMTPDGQRFLLQLEPEQIPPLVLVDHDAREPLRRGLAVAGSRSLRTQAPPRAHDRSPRWLALPRLTGGSWTSPNRARHCRRCRKYGNMAS